MVSLILKKPNAYIYREQTGCCQRWGVKGGQMREGVKRCKLEVMGEVLGNAICHSSTVPTVNI